MKSGVILAGGRSIRVGSDKRFADFKGKPLIQWSVDALKPVVDEIIFAIAFEDDEHLISHLSIDEMIVVKDEISFRGPIHGLLHSFTAAKGEYIAVAPCDSPFISSSFYTLMFELAVGSDAAVPRINGHWEPLLAVYHREKMIEGIKRTLAEGQARPIDVYDKIEVMEVTEEMIKEKDLNLGILTNINSKEDLERARIKNI